MLKKKSAPKLKEKVWTAFSKYIRIRDCLRTTSTTVQGRCVSCGQLFDFYSLQAGHFIPGRHNAVLFDEKNVHAQCVGCNIFKKGNLIPYFIEMERMYGRETIDELRERDKREIKNFKIYELEEMLEDYKERFKKLEKDKIL